MCFFYFATLDNNEGGVEEGVELGCAAEEEDQGQFDNQGKPPKPFIQCPIIFLMSCITFSTHALF